MTDKPPCFDPKCQTCPYTNFCNNSKNGPKPCTAIDQVQTNKEPKHYTQAEEAKPGNRNLGASMTTGNRKRGGQPRPGQMPMDERRRKISEALLDGPKTLGLICEEVYGENLDSTDARKKDLYNDVSRMRKEGIICDRMGEYGREYYLEGYDGIETGREDD